MHIVIVDLCLRVFLKTVFEKRRKYAEEIWHMLHGEGKQR